MPLRTDPIALPDLGALESGAPRLLPLDSIDEDPDQPRSEFDPAALEELAATIRLRGVLQPVSVRPHPNEHGRWMLNFGSRRFRASRLADRAVIPAFVDDACDTYAQVIENEQRESLQAMELALFVQRRRALGETQAEIARLLGKSKTYVSMANALIDAPDWLMRLYREGRCRGLTELYQLRRLHEHAARPVEAWCAGRAEIGRAEIKALGASLGPADAATPPVRSATSLQRARTNVPSRRSVPTSPRSRLLATLDGSTVIVVTDEVPAEPSMIFVVDRATAQRSRVSASAVVLVGFDAVSGS